MQSSLSPGLDLAGAVGPCSHSHPCSLCSFPPFIPPLTNATSLSRVFWLRLLPALSLQDSRLAEAVRKSSSGCRGRSLPCGHLVLAPHLALGAAFVPGPAAVWVQLCTQRGAKQPWVVALHSWGAPGRSGGGQVLALSRRFPPLFVWGKAEQSSQRASPTSPCPGGWSNAFCPELCLAQPAEGLLPCPISPCSVCSHALFPHAAKANHAYLRLLEHVRLPGTRALTHGHMVAVPCPAPRLPRACAHRRSLPSLPSQGLGVLKGSRPPSPSLAPQDLIAGRAWSCPPSTTDPVWGSLCPAADVYWAQQAPSRPRSTHGAPGQTPARPTRSFDVSRPAWDQSRPGCAPPLPSPGSLLNPLLGFRHTMEGPRS